MILSIQALWLAGPWGHGGQGPTRVNMHEPIDWIYYLSFCYFGGSGAFVHATRRMSE